MKVETRIDIHNNHELTVLPVLAFQHKNTSASVLPVSISLNPWGIIFYIGGYTIWSLYPIVEHCHTYLYPNEERV